MKKITFILLDLSLGGKILHLIVDSACDIPLVDLQEKGVVIMPLTVGVDDQEFVDMFEISNKQIYSFIEDGKHPTTSQVNIGKFVDTFTELAEAKQSGLYIGLSSDLSGTYQAAVLAKQQVLEDYPELDVRLIDSRNASLGVGIMVLEAMKMMDDNKSLDEIEARIQWMLDQVVAVFTVNDLNYLAAGGRLSKSSAFIGGLLNIQPILEVENGKLATKQKLRGRKRVLNRMYERLQAEAKHVEEQTVYIVHTDEHETVQAMKDHISTHIRPAKVVDYPIGAAICAHTGLGTIGVFYLKDTK